MAGLPYTHVEMAALEAFVKRIQNNKITASDAARQYRKKYPERSYNSIRHKLRDLAGENKAQPPASQIIKEPTETGMTVEEWFVKVNNYTLRQPPAKKVKGVKSNEASLVIVLSDLHDGKRSKEFDSAVLESRISATLCQTRRFAPRVDEVVVCLVGDLVQGTGIYPNQEISLEYGAMSQVMHVTQILWAWMKLLQEQFECPVRVVSVPGNHGRLGKQAAEEDNLDNLALYSLVCLARNYDSIEVEESYSPFNVVDIKGHRCLLNHVGMKHVGTPTMQRKAGAWLSYNECDIFITGHDHTASISDGWMGKLVIQNGSVCGEDDFGERHALFNPARQVAFLLERGQKPAEFRFLRWD